MLEQAGIVGDLVPFTFRVRVLGQGGVRPGEVLEALLSPPEGALPELPARVVRTFMGRGALDPLALEALRAQYPGRSSGAPERDLDDELAPDASDSGDEFASHKAV